MKNQKSSCPICSKQAPLFTTDNLRDYFKCSCDLVFVCRSHLISPQEECSRYLTHENNETDPRYRAYLEKTVHAVTPLLGHRKLGLDFGCGASFLLEKIFEEQGYEVDSYDIYFHPETPIWNKKYDFIILSEVIEHLRQPLEEMKRLRTLLAPNGIIFIKTKYHPGGAKLFDEWFYKRDPTHIQFFSEGSMSELAKKLELKGGFSTGLQDLVYIID